MSRDSTKKALEGYFARQLPKRPSGKKNMKPERDQVEIPCLKWFEMNGFLMSKVESKAVHSERAGRYLRGQAEAGLSDSLGSAPDGTAAFVEFKAPGALGTIRLAQYEFLKARIDLGCFAVCVDSVETLNRHWMAFESMRMVNRHRAYLMSVLPIPRQLRRESDEPTSLF